MMAFVKFVHIAAIAIWAAGLLTLPLCYRQLGQLQAARNAPPHHAEPELRLHRAVRFIYVIVVSPAAFIAVGSGILLIFQRSMVAPWFSVKLALVAALVVAHTLAGLTLSRIFDQANSYPPWRSLVTATLVFVLTCAIFTLTLSKPNLTTDRVFPPAFSEPGALKPLIQSIIPWQRS